MLCHNNTAECVRQRSARHEEIIDRPRARNPPRRNRAGAKVRLCGHPARLFQTATSTPRCTTPSTGCRARLMRRRSPFPWQQRFRAGQQRAGVDWLPRCVAFEGDFGPAPRLIAQQPPRHARRHRRHQRRGHHRAVFHKEILYEVVTWRTSVRAARLVRPTDGYSRGTPPALPTFLMTSWH